MKERREISIIRGQNIVIKAKFVGEKRMKFILAGGMSEQ